jgi:multidrug efflux pump subunit AcrA (membrane-fusion protein)
MHERSRSILNKFLLFSLVAGATLAMPGCGRTQAAAPAPLPEVRVAPVVQQDVPVYSEWVARLDGYVNAQVRPQVSGYMIKQNYKEGSLVHRGQVLFEIDPRPFQAALDRAKGDLAQAQAQLGKRALWMWSATDLLRRPGVLLRVNWITRFKPSWAPRPPSNRTRRPWRNAVCDAPTLSAVTWKRVLLDRRKTRGPQIRAMPLQ